MLPVAEDRFVSHHWQLFGVVLVSRARSAIR